MSATFIILSAITAISFSFGIYRLVRLYFRLDKEEETYSSPKFKVISVTHNYNRSYIKYHFPKSNQSSKRANIVELKEEIYSAEGVYC